MRQHHTIREKKERKKAYKKLRKAGFSVKVSRVLRDWTDSKIEKIINKEAKPTILYSEKYV